MRKSIQGATFTLLSIFTLILITAGLGPGLFADAVTFTVHTGKYEIIDREEKTEAKVKEFFHFKELYYYFLVPAVLLLILEILLKTTILRVIP